jgi:hypothetical protein
MKLRRLSFVLLAAFSISCASQKRFVADQTAAHHYHLDRYNRACVEIKGPPSCKDFQTLINLQLRLTKTANEVSQIGKLPSEEKKELKVLMAKIQKLP